MFFTDFILHLAVFLRKVGTVPFLFFRKSVLYGILSAVLVFSAFQLGVQAGVSAKARQIAELQRMASIKILDRNGVLLYTFRKDDNSTSIAEYKRAPSFVDYTLQKLKENYGDAIFLYGGTVKTTLDLQLQNKVQAKVIEDEMQNPPASDATSAVVLDPHSNQILALVSSPHYFENPLTKDQQSNTKEDLETAKPFLEVLNYKGKVLYSNPQKVETLNLEYRYFNLSTKEVSL